MSILFCPVCNRIKPEFCELPRCRYYHAPPLPDSDAIELAVEHLRDNPATESVADWLEFHAGEAFIFQAARVVGVDPASMRVEVEGEDGDEDGDECESEQEDDGA